MDQRTVITGIGIISPLGLDSKTTWKALLAGKSGVKRITSFDTDSFIFLFTLEMLCFLNFSNIISDYFLLSFKRFDFLRKINK